MRTFSLWVGLVSCFAAGAVFASTRVVTSTSDDVNDAGSLRHMIEIADAGDTITFDLQYPAVIELSAANTDPGLLIRKSLVIMGPGADKLAIHPATDNSGIYVTQPDVSTSDISVSIYGLTVENTSQTAIAADDFTGIPPYSTSLHVADSVIANSSLGVYVAAGAMVSVVRTTISGTSGAINATTSASVTVVDSTVKDNVTGIVGDDSTITVINSTLSRNSPTGGAGVIGSSNSAITLLFTTISGSPLSLGHGVYRVDAGTVITLKNSLIAGYPAGNCVAASTVASADYNLSDDVSCSLAGIHDINNVPAGLDPAGLSWAGGPTETIWLSPSSPALNAIPIVNCTDGADGAVTTDQRGATRPDAGACDIGAMESDRLFAATFG